ncbi:hypothetical protein ACU4GD_35430 [Cupriavidus basilensis]
MAARLAGLRTHHRRGAGRGDAVAVLAETLAEAGGADAVRRDGDALVWIQGAALGEYLGEPVDKEVSARHVAWLAGLLWLDEAGGALTRPLREAARLSTAPPSARPSFPRIARGVDRAVLTRWRYAVPGSKRQCGNEKWAPEGAHFSLPENPLQAVRPARRSSGSSRSTSPGFPRP